MPSISNRAHLIKIITAFAAIYVIWGTTYLAIRIAVETIPPFLMAGVRFVIAGTIVFIILRLRGVPVPRRFHWRSAAIVGALLLVGGNGFVTWAEQEIPSGMAALIVATVPLWMMLFEWLRFRGETPNRLMVVSIIVGFGGVIILVGPFQLFSDSSFDFLSLVVILVAPILWSFGSLYSRQVDLPDNIFMSTTIQMLAGGVLLLLMGLVTGETRDLDLSLLSLESLAAMLYLTLFGSIAAFTAYIWLLKNVESSKVSTYTYVNPLIAVYLGWFVLNEEVAVSTIVSLVAIVLSVIILTTRRKKARVSEHELPAAANPISCEALTD